MNYNLTLMLLVAPQKTIANRLLNNLLAIFLFIISTFLFHFTLSLFPYINKSYLKSS